MNRPWRSVYSHRGTHCVDQTGFRLIETPLPLPSLCWSAVSEGVHTMSGPVCFLTHPGPPAQGSTAHIGRAISYKSLIKKTPHRLASRPI